MEVKVKKYDRDEVLLELPGEDHTLCNLLKWALNRKEGIVATYRIEHPILGKRHKVEDEQEHVPPKVRIRAVDEDADAREALWEVIDELLELIEEARREFQGALEEAEG
ncbi:MAG: RpoL/Rpb11 RNA polymerase subunit family protein [Methanopyraceae archaeon]